MRPDSSVETAAGAVIVAGHVCLDIIPRWSAEAPFAIDSGVLIEVGPADLSTGGAVANVGLCLKKLGLEPRLIGRVGDDLFGRAVLDRLARAGVATDSMQVVAGETTSYSIVISPPRADRAFLHCAGANDRFDPDDVGEEMLRGARILHFGYPQIMRGVWADCGERLARMFERARAAGLITSLDTAQVDPAAPAAKVDWRRFFARVLPHVDVFTPSYDEIVAMLPMLGASHDIDPARLRQVSSLLLSLGPAVVLLKLGSNGLHAATSHETSPFARMANAATRIDSSVWRARELNCPCFDATPVGTTGAGDATVAGFLAALALGMTLERAVTIACGVGACSVEAPDASSGVPALSVVERRVNEGWARRRPHSP